MNDSSKLRKLLIATGNTGKVKEMRKLLEDLDFEFLSLQDFPNIKIVEEVCKTYEENAVLKCVSYAETSGNWALADDSGLEVDALDGAPGVFSARYAGVGATDGDRVDLLLAQISQTSDDRRTARFRCVAALADAKGKVLKIAEGICEGRIAREPRGQNGFGYDPVFVPAGYDLTFAELPAAEKDRISHRAIAVGRIKEFLLGSFFV